MLVINTERCIVLSELFPVWVAYRAEEGIKMYPLHACVITDQLTEVVKVFIAGQIVANDVVGLPTSKQGEAWPDLHLHRVIQDLEMGGGDVANLISVVHILGRGGKNSLEKYI